MLRFTVTELDREELAEAWPLVRATSPELALEEWQARAGALIERGGGVVGVSAEGGGFLGIATYEPVERPHAGRVLQVDTLVSFELTRQAPIRRILCEELEEMAPRLGCAGTAVNFGSRSYLGHRMAAALHGTARRD